MNKWPFKVANPNPKSKQIEFLQFMQTSFETIFMTVGPSLESVLTSWPCKVTWSATIILKFEKNLISTSSRSCMGYRRVMWNIQLPVPTRTMPK